MEPIKTTKTSTATTNGTDEPELCKAVAKVGLRTPKGCYLLFIHSFHFGQSLNLLTRWNSKRGRSLTAGRECFVLNEAFTFTNRRDRVRRSICCALWRSRSWWTPYLFLIKRDGQSSGIRLDRIIASRTRRERNELPEGNSLLERNQLRRSPWRGATLIT